LNPIVAVTTWKRYTNTFLGEKTPNYTLMDFYADALEEAGATTLLIARLDPADADRILDRVDGLILTGGGDIGPDQYRQDNTDSINIDPGADVRDVALVQAAQQRGMPVLGICRGHQAVNVALGGALHQHMTADGDQAHPTFSDHAEERNADRHLVEFAEDSRLAAIYGVSERKVNSLHHQSVSELGDGMRAVGWAPDGHIEASESTTDWPVLCVQWHPEMLSEEAEARLFSAFVDDAQEYRDQ
jgi:putative glutamine amidotransferase